MICFVLEKGVLDAKIIGLIHVNENKHYEIVERIKVGERCIVVLDKTNFYSEKGGQQSDFGEIQITNDSILSVKVDYVEQLQGYVFHYGVYGIAETTEQQSSPDLKVNESVLCNVDGQKRFNSTMNHTGVHILNHSIRSFYNEENSIIQVNSSAKEHNLKFEFLLNRKKLDKPDKNDMKSIEAICKNIVDKGLPIYESKVDLDVIDLKSNQQPVRRLRDVLYPRNVRVVSIGEKLDYLLDSSKTSSSLNTDYYSSELCCGTHAVNTKQLENFKIIDFTLSGDAYYEIEACTSQKAVEIEENEKKVEKIYEKIAKLDQQSNSGLHEIAKTSIEIELLTKKLQLSYFYRLQLKENLDKYRPSKHKLQKILSKHFEDQIKLNSNTNKQFIAFDSVLSVDQIVSCINQVKQLPSITILNNEFRKTLIIKLDEKLDENKREKLFETFELAFKDSNVKLIFQSLNKEKTIKSFKFDQTVAKDDLNRIYKTIEDTLNI